MRQRESAGPPAELALSRRRRRRRRRRKRLFRRLVPAAILLLAIFALLQTPLFTAVQNALPVSGSPAKLQRYAREQGVSLSAYPESLIELYQRNPETEQFVFEYPLVKDNPPADDLSGLDTSSVPLLMQWDQRWGYGQYAGNVFGLSGCGPTCLSMVAIYLTGDTSMTPKWMGEFASSHGYAVEGSGSAWALFSEGGKELGLDVTEIPLDKNRIIANLEVNNPIVAVMGPGDFTTTGHFIVITGYENGKLKVDDPNNRANSEKLWEYDQIQSQIRDLWVFRNL